MRYAVILAGGSGKRLWPLSRTSKPKQLLHLLEGKSLLDMADRYRQAGKDDAAAKNLRQVIKDFPNTDWAAKAKEQLANIGQ